MFIFEFRCHSVLIKSIIVPSAISRSETAKSMIRHLAKGAPGCIEGVGYNGFVDTRQSRQFIRQLHSSVEKRSSQCRR